MKNKLLSLALTAMSIATLAGCNKNVEELEVKFGDIVPVAYVGEEYDFSYILEEENGVSYSLEAYYHNPYEYKEYKLEVSDLCFTPTDAYEITAVCTATKGDETAKRSCVINVIQRGDPIEELLVTNGFSGFADAGIKKDIETNEVYRKEGCGATSIAVHYSGNNPYTWGCSVFAPTNFRCLPYWEDQTWENTILTFWVYNPTDYDIEFQLRVKDNYTGLVDFDWGHSIGISQKAKPNQWTQIFFSMHKVGVDHTLYINEEGTRNDSIIIKTKWAGTPGIDPVTQSCPVYSYQFYVDGLDFVPNTKYPDIDTRCTAKAETIESGWENMLLDTTKSNGYAAADAYYSREVVRQSELNPDIKSKSSGELAFKDVTIKHTDWGYGVCYNVASEFNGVTNDLPNFSHGVLTADIKFSDNITDKTTIFKAVNEGWNVNVETEVELAPLEDDWYRFSIDFAAEGTFSKVNHAIRFGFKFPGINAGNKDTAIINIDNIFFDQHAGTPEPPEPETVQDGYENLIIDAGYSASKQKYIMDVCENNPNSKYALELTFDGVYGYNYGPGLVDIGYGVAFQTQGTTYLQDWTSGKIELDVKFSENVTDHKLRMRVLRDWDNDAHIDVEPSQTLSNGWYHYVINIADNATLASFRQSIRVIFAFFGVTAQNKATAKVIVDNITKTA